MEMEEEAPALEDLTGQEAGTADISDSEEEEASELSVPGNDDKTEDFSASWLLFWRLS